MFSPFTILPNFREDNSLCLSVSAQETVRAGTEASGIKNLTGSVDGQNKQNKTKQKFIKITSLIFKHQQNKKEEIDIHQS